MTDHDHESQQRVLRQAVELHKAITDSLKKTGGNTGDADDADWAVFGLIAGGYVVFGAGDIACISARPRSFDDKSASEQAWSLGSDELSENRIGATADLIRELRNKAAVAEAKVSPAKTIVAGLLAGGYIEFEGTENITVNIHADA